MWLDSYRRRQDPPFAPRVHAERVGLALKPAGPHFTARVLCGFGQQHPLRAPQHEQRIAFEIVSSGVSMQKP
jgi:hypothetical protein